MAAGQLLALKRHDSHSRLVAEDAAIVRRVADRGADVAADLQARHAGRQGRRRAAGIAAGGTLQVPGVVGGAVDLVEALPVRQVQRDVGLAVDDGAGGLQC